MHAAKENIVKKDNSIAAECVCPLKIPLTVWVSLWKRATVRQPPVSMHVSAIFSGLENIFGKLCFRGGFVWKRGLTLEIAQRFQISTAKVIGRGRDTRKRWILRLQFASYTGQINPTCMRVFFRVLAISDRDSSEFAYSFPCSLSLMHLFHSCR